MDGHRARVLVADDDRATRESLSRALQLEGYDVEAVPDGDAALAATTTMPLDALVLDVMMPKLDGLSVCRRLRGHQDRTPILMLTARSEIPDRISGLDAGADDYLAKPFALEELLARLRALLRRANGETFGGEIITGDLRIDPAARRAWRGARELELTKTEFDILELLARNAGIVLEPSTIYDRIWGYDFGPDSKNLAVYVGYLRRKIEVDGMPRLITTVRGVGYTLREP